MTISWFHADFFYHGKKISLCILFNSFLICFLRYGRPIAFESFQTEISFMLPRYNNNKKEMESSFFLQWLHRLCVKIPLHISLKTLFLFSPYYMSVHVCVLNWRRKKEERCEVFGALCRNTLKVYYSKIQKKYFNEKRDGVCIPIITHSA